ncbi:leucine rich repeat containing 48 [Planoprotostelium fungivorum]|uniref:Dynein regulatory complex subunit 3 n=1 Tax=Planoprotostelium fungivorum TaxID=1890364 RepID=A0A2P6NJQ6_9EUKA|nr:leucine rich repeat containing 48 [Planoprotostelium fungivorum]
MNKLYNSIDPIVIDDELLKLVIDDGKESKDSKEKSKPLSQQLEELTTLQLPYKRIRRIDNLSGLNELTKLQLDNNDIETIENLDHLVHLTWIDLSFNKIKKIEGLNQLKKLTDISLHSNQITTLEGMDDLQELTLLSVGANKIASLDNILYLRRFKNLSALNLAKNPVAELPDYKMFVVARLSNLRYLDYRLLDETTVRGAREQYQEDLQVIQAKEKEADEKEDAKRTKIARLSLLRGANLQDFDTFFEDLISEDAEYMKVAPLRALNDVLSEYKERFQEATNNFVVHMLEHHDLRIQERGQFDLVCQKVQKLNDDKALALFDEFGAKKKKVFKELKGEKLARSEAIAKLEELKTSTSLFYDQLMDQETNIVEQIEEFIREFETRLSELTGHALEIIRG